MSDALPQPSHSPEDIRAHAAAEAKLIELCENLVMQGDFLAANDIRVLGEWFRDHVGSEIPAIAHLGFTVRRVSLDAELTEDEHEQLFDAIEGVVAPEVRAAVRAKQT
jgi:hypothetical protein